MLFLCLSYSYVCFIFSIIFHYKNSSRVDHVRLVYLNGKYMEKDGRFCLMDDTIIKDRFFVKSERKSDFYSCEKLIMILL